MSNEMSKNEEQGVSREMACFLGEMAECAYSADGVVAGQLGNRGMKLLLFLDRQGTQGFVGGNDKMMVLAFRGTEPPCIADWLTDFDIGLVAGPGGRVHEGAYVALNYVWRDVWRYIHEKRQSRTLWVTGHSLGGALATLATAKLRLEKDEPVNGLCTFGQPRVGDRDFAARFDADFAAKAFRYVNNNDIVPRVPFRALGYSHVGMFRYFDAEGVQHDNEMIWWEKLVDRMTGRVQDLLIPGSDGLKDHFMERYLENLRRAASCP